MKLVEDGREAPKEFFQQPEILPQHQLYMEAFNELSTERQIGMGVGPIPRSAIRAYAQELGIVGDEFEHFHRIIRLVDNDYLQAANSSKKPDEANLVDASDPDSVRQVFKRLQKRASSAKRKPAVKH